MPSNQDRPLSGYILEEDVELTMGDLTRACSVRADVIVDLVDEGVINPTDPANPRWTFQGTTLPRLRVALNLQRDLDLNLAGVALALQLMDDIDQLEAQLRRMPAPMWDNLGK